MRLHPFLEFGAPIALAHRGGAREHPENTMAAFEAVIRSGYRYLDLDTQSTADGVLVIYRSNAIQASAGAKDEISALPYERIAQMRLGDSERIPRLTDILGTFPQAKFNLRLTTDAATQAFIAAARGGGVLERICVASNSLTRLETVREAFGDEVCTALAPSEIFRMSLGASGLPSGAIGGRCVQVPLTWPAGLGLWHLDERFISTAHAASMPVLVGIVDDKADMIRLIELGVDGLMTDRPALLQAVLESNGMWWRADSAARRKIV